MKNPYNTKTKFTALISGLKSLFKLQALQEKQVREDINK